MSKRQPKPAETPVCPYCGKLSVFMPTSEKLYRGTDFGPAYACEPCGAWVGCHKGTRHALGRLANAELRKAKIAAHAAFDQLWKRKMARDQIHKHAARSAGYAWLAKQLDVPTADCHIGMFDVERCRRVVEVCAPYVGGGR